MSTSYSPELALWRKLDRIERDVAILRAATIFFCVTSAVSFAVASFLIARMFQ